MSKIERVKRRKKGKKYLSDDEPKEEFKNNLGKVKRK